MNILAIDSSGLVASTAIMRDNTLVAEYTLNNKMTHSQTLLPMLDEVIKRSGVDKKDIDAIAIAAGPGSFTGLRIGAATAKGLGLALDIPLIRVPTVDAYAYNLFGTDRIICPLMDARRSQVYTGLYTFEGDNFQVIKEQSALSIEDITAAVNELAKPVIFLGDGEPVNRQFLDENVKVDKIYAPAHMARQRAGAVAALAARYVDDEKYPAIRRESAAEHIPEYLRLSQAERELLEKEKAGKNP